jgi:hypothetical protein
VGRWDGGGGEDMDREVGKRWTLAEDGQGGCWRLRDSEGGQETGG